MMITANPTRSQLWIEPTGKVHEFDDVTHGKWAMDKLGVAYHPELEEDADGFTKEIPEGWMDTFEVEQEAQSQLLKAGWIRMGFFRRGHAAVVYVQKDSPLTPAELGRAQTWIMQHPEWQGPAIDVQDPKLWTVPMADFLAAKKTTEFRGLKTAAGPIPLDTKLIDRVFRAIVSNIKGYWGNYDAPIGERELSIAFSLSATPTNVSGEERQGLNVKLVFEDAYLSKAVRGAEVYPGKWPTLAVYLSGKLTGQDITKRLEGLEGFYLRGILVHELAHVFDHIPDEALGVSPKDNAEAYYNLDTEVSAYATQLWHYIVTNADYYREGGADWLRKTGEKGLWSLVDSALTLRIGNGIRRYCNEANRRYILQVAYRAMQEVLESPESKAASLKLAQDAGITKADLQRIRPILREWVGGGWSDGPQLMRLLEKHKDILAKFRMSKPVRLWRNERAQILTRGGQDVTGPSNAGWEDQYTRPSAWSATRMHAESYASGNGRRLVTAIVPPEDTYCYIPLVEQAARALGMKTFDPHQQDEVIVRPNPSFLDQIRPKVTVGEEAQLRRDYELAMVEYHLPQLHELRKTNPKAISDEELKRRIADIAKHKEIHDVRDELAKLQRGKAARKNASLIAAHFDEKQALSRTRYRAMTAAQARVYQPKRVYEEDVLVTMDVAKVDASWRQDSTFYIEPGGGNQLRGRYDRFAQWLQDNQGTPIDPPDIGLTPSGEIIFGNGRHRFAVLRDQGAKRIAATVPRADLKVMIERFGAQPVQGTSITASGAVQALVGRAKQLTKQDPLSEALGPYECGAFDGGCLICAEALISAAGRGDLVRLVDVKGRTHHYGARIDGLYCDFSGAYPSGDMWAKTFARLEHVREALHAEEGLDPNYQEEETPRDPQCSREIAQLLLGSKTAKTFDQLYPATPEWVGAAKAFFLKKWQERAQERGMSLPVDVSNACKFGSRFAQKLFGGTLRGNWHHQFVQLPDGQRVDLGEDALDRQTHGDDASWYAHDKTFWGNREHRESMASVEPRVTAWVTEFQKEHPVSRIAKTLYHGTSTERAQRIQREGLEPQVGDLTATAYEDDAESVGEELEPLTFAGDKDALQRGVYSAMLHAIQAEGHDITDAEQAIRNWGALVILKDGDEVMDHRPETEDPYGYSDHPLQVETGDYYSREGLVPDHILTGPTLVRYLKRNGVNLSRWTKPFSEQKRNALVGMVRRAHPDVPVEKILEKVNALTFEQFHKSWDYYVKLERAKAASNNEDAQGQCHCTVCGTEIAEGRVCTECAKTCQKCGGPTRNCKCASFVHAKDALCHDCWGKSKTAALTKEDIQGRRRALEAFFPAELVQAAIDEAPDGETYTMPLDEALDEHERLIQVLKSPDHTDDLQEAKEQEAELRKMKAAGSVTIGFNVNDSEMPWTEMILAGRKTIETRDSDSLRPHVGERVGIVRTGHGPATLVGYCTLGEPKVYRTNEEFRADNTAHQIPAGPQWDLQPGAVKFGYPISQVEACEPQPVSGQGRVFRRLAGGGVHGWLLPDGSFRDASGGRLREHWEVALSEFAPHAQRPASDDDITAAMDAAFDAGWVRVSMQGVDAQKWTDTLLHRVQSFLQERGVLSGLRYYFVDSGTPVWSAKVEPASELLQLNKVTDLRRYTKVAAKTARYLTIDELRARAREVEERTGKSSRQLLEELHVSQDGDAFPGFVKEAKPIEVPGELLDALVSTVIPFLETEAAAVSPAQWLHEVSAGEARWSWHVGALVQRHLGDVGSAFPQLRMQVGFDRAKRFPQNRVTEAWSDPSTGVISILMAQPPTYHPIPTALVADLRQSLAHELAHLQQAAYQGVGAYTNRMREIAPTKNPDTFINTNYEVKAISAEFAEAFSRALHGDPTLSVEQFLSTQWQWPHIQEGMAPDARARILKDLAYVATHASAPKRGRRHSDHGSHRRASQNSVFYHGTRHDGPKPGLTGILWLTEDLHAAAVDATTHAHHGDPGCWKLTLDPQAHLVALWDLDVPAVRTVKDEASQHHAHITGRGVTDEEWVRASANGPRLETLPWMLRRLLDLGVDGVYVHEPVAGRKQLALALLNQDVVTSQEPAPLTHDAEVHHHVVGSRE